MIEADRSGSRSATCRSWELLVATLVTKVVVPVLYVLFVEDFKLIRWSAPGEQSEKLAAGEQTVQLEHRAPVDHPYPAASAGQTLAGAF